MERRGLKKWKLYKIKEVVKLPIMFEVFGVFYFILINIFTDFWSWFNLIRVQPARGEGMSLLSFLKIGKFTLILGEKMPWLCSSMGRMFHLKCGLGEYRRKFSYEAFLLCRVDEILPKWLHSKKPPTLKKPCLHSYLNLKS